MSTGFLSANDNLSPEIVKWALAQLSLLGYTLKSDQPENVLNTHWSHVLRFETAAGYIYLKHTPDLIALEAQIIKILHEQFFAPVPEVIADNPDLNCFLMKDAGRSLRGILKQKFDTNLLCRAINEFCKLQTSVADHVAVFLDIGVPDWRLNHLPQLFQKLLQEKEVLLADGLTEKEIFELNLFSETVHDLCERLSAHSIQQTLVQSDFHDNNILIDEINALITFIDLGEIVISHPFFSLIGCLRQTIKHHGLTEQDPRYQHIQDASLQYYQQFESQQALRKAFAIAQALWFVYDALCQYRLMLACGIEKIMSYQRGKMANGLKQFMTACKTLNDS